MPRKHIRLFFEIEFLVDHKKVKFDIHVVLGFICLCCAGRQNVHLLILLHDHNFGRLFVLGLRYDGLEFA